MIPKKGNIYSVNKGNAKNWEKPITENVDNCMFPQDGSSPKSLRYVGSMVVDIHRTLLYGGIFMYLVDKKNPDGKLRLQLQMSTCLASKESQKVEVAIGIIRRSSQ
ncbi:fructose-1,6-bisphosphatase, cytosolic-like isoform X1 [Arachis hypogaea]|uniref:fructose-1,6-bisphosphatase, cytosolic-like isoform X1 n=1 Tax=Arachis hypogaea TaxID=3818 RepID=UPI0034E733E2